MKITFDLDSKQITIEGEGPELTKLLIAAEKIAPSLSEIHIKKSGAGGEQRERAPAEPLIGEIANNGGQTPSGLTLRQFVRGLDLSNIAEKVAAIAYYEKHYENRSTFSPKEMGAWFTYAGFQRPVQMPVAVYDCKVKYGFLESSGHAKWKLTTSGENLIVGKLEANRSDE